MASPLLEAGAIDGARGILINITGSSTLKLSEVNEASSLIQSAAHEDANIIFGAVLDEKMGDEVKITVIATGFRDQMPERRARMLNVEDAPVVSVPGCCAGNWMRETEPEPAPASPRAFMSEEEDEAAKARKKRIFLRLGRSGSDYHGHAWPRRRSEGLCKCEYGVGASADRDRRDRNPASIEASVDSGLPRPGLCCGVR